MTIHQAEQLIRDFESVLPQGTDKGSRRNPSLLPAPKEQVLKAIKLEIAQLYFINSTGEDQLKPLIHAAMLIDTFNDIPFPPATFIESMQRRRQEIDGFYLDLMKLDRADPFYWQRVYTLLGITFDTQKTSFFAGVREKFRFTQKPSPEEPAVGGNQSTDRFTLD